MHKLTVTMTVHTRTEEQAGYISKLLNDLASLLDAENTSVVSVTTQVQGYLSETRTTQCGHPGPREAASTCVLSTGHFPTLDHEDKFGGTWNWNDRFEGCTCDLSGALKHSKKCLVHGP